MLVLEARGERSMRMGGVGGGVMMSEKVWRFVSCRVRGYGRGFFLVFTCLVLRFVCFVCL